jgi:PPOX class probable F420-dependent enzyme
MQESSDRAASSDWDDAARSARQAGAVVPARATPVGRPYAAVSAVFMTALGTSPRTVISMAEEMTEAVWKAFITEGTRTGKLATVRSDGSPHIAPMWFLLDGDDLVFTTEKETVKGRNLLRDERAELCLDDERPPYSFVVLRGRVEISEEPRLLLTWATSIAARYMGEDRAQEFGERNSVPGMLLVRMRIEHVTAYAAIA